MVALNGRRNWWPKRCHDTRHYLGEVSCVYNAIHRNRNSVTSACYIVRGCSISFPFLSLSFFLSPLLAFLFSDAHAERNGIVYFSLWRGDTGRINEDSLEFVERKILFWCGMCWDSSLESFRWKLFGISKSKRACKFILLQLCLLVFIYSKLIKEEGIVVNI